MRVDDGILEKWWYDHLNHVVWGFIYSDRKERFYDGTYIHTSNLSMPRDPDLVKGQEIKTRNSTYILGEPQ